MNSKTKGTIYVLLCIAMWALVPIVAKTGQTELDNHQFLFWSSLVSFLVIAITVVVKGKLRHIFEYSGKDWLWFSFLGLLGTYIYYLLLYFGYAKAKGLEVLVIQYTWPSLIVVFSILILKERLTLKKSIAVLLGFLGVLLVLSKGNLAQIKIDNPVVIALVGAGAACFALFSVLSKNVEKEPLGVVAVYFLVATVASLFSMLGFSEFALPSSSEIPPVLINGIIVNGFSYVIWLLALRATEASYLAPFTFITPVLSAIYLILFFDEPFLPAYAIGLLLVVVGGLINSVTIKSRK
jgi:drug/metabolite transporter (DMT)-like permease